MTSQQKYYFQFSMLCLGSFLLAYGLGQVPVRYFSTPHFWVPTVFFALTALGINALLTRGDKQSKEFVFKTLAMSMARLLVCMIVVFIYSRIFKESALAFTCHFMIQYVVFTLFEMSFLLKYIKTN